MNSLMKTALGCVVLFFFAAQAEEEKTSEPAKTAVEKTGEVKTEAKTERKAAAKTEEKEEEKLDDKSNAPAAVYKAISTLFPKGKLKKIEKDQQGKVRRFKIVVEDDEGEHTAELRSDGTVAERTDPVKPEALPLPVDNTLKARSPRGKVTKATKSTKGTAVTYELTVEQDGQPKTYTLDEKGKDPPKLEK